MKLFYSIKLIMEQFVLFAFEESLIKFKYHRVFIGFLDDHGVVSIVQTSCSGCLGSVAGSGRLSASHNTATTACHNFDQMILCFAVLYTIHDNSRIGKSAGYTDLNLHALV